MFVCSSSVSSSSLLLICVSRRPYIVILSSSYYLRFASSSPLNICVSRRPYCRSCRAATTASRQSASRSSMVPLHRRHCLFSRFARALFCLHRRLFLFSRVPRRDASYFGVQQSAVKSHFCTFTREFDWSRACTLNLYIRQWVRQYEFDRSIYSSRALLN